MWVSTVFLAKNQRASARFAGPGARSKPAVRGRRPAVSSSWADRSANETGSWANYSDTVNLTVSPAAAPQPRTPKRAASARSAGTTMAEWHALCAAARNHALAALGLAGVGWHAARKA